MNKHPPTVLATAVALKMFEMVEQYRSIAGVFRIYNFIELVERILDTQKFTG